MTVVWFPEDFAEALWFLVYVGYSWFQNYPKCLLPLLGPSKCQGLMTPPAFAGLPCEVVSSLSLEG